MFRIFTISIYTISIFIIILVSLCTFFLVGCQSDNSNSLSIPNTQIERFYSKSIGDYKITIYTPNKPAPKEGWPIIYLLDGDSYFLTAYSILINQSCERCRLQEGVIVAIDYFDKTRRSQDYLLKPDELTLEVLPNNKINYLEHYGGADEFFNFIQNELKPHIESEFSINKTKQTIFGHSYGGLFVLHALFKHPLIFTTYIASSPSVWFSGRYIFKEANDFIKKNKNTKLSYFVNLAISVGENEQSLISSEKNLPQAKQSMLLQHRENRRMVDSTNELFQLLNKANIKNMNLRYEHYPNQTHQTSPIIALQNGIQIDFQH